MPYYYQFTQYISTLLLSTVLQDMYMSLNTIRVIEST